MCFNITTKISTGYTLYLNLCMFKIARKYLYTHVTIYKYLTYIKLILGNGRITHYSTVILIETYHF